MKLKSLIVLTFLASNFIQPITMHAEPQPSKQVALEDTEWASADSGMLLQLISAADAEKQKTALQNSLKHRSIMVRTAAAKRLFGLKDEQTISAFAEAYVKASLPVAGGTEDVIAQGQLMRQLALNMALALNIKVESDRDDWETLVLQKAKDSLLTHQLPSENVRERQPEPSIHAPPMVQPPATKKTPEATPTLATPSEEPSSPTRWPLAAVVVVAVLGLLWVWLKKRK